LSEHYNKAAMYKRLKAGEFGNTALTWDSIGEFLESNFSGEIMIRYKGTGTKRFWQPGIDSSEAFRIVNEWIKQGADPNLISIGEWINTDWSLMHAEVAASEKHLELYYSRVKAPLRESLLAGGQTVEGLTAISVMQSVMDPKSYEWICHLCHTSSNEFIHEPRPVVEFSVFDRPVGTHHEPVVIWEVRSDITAKCCLPFPKPHA